MGASLRLGRILGIPVEVNVSWIIVFMVLTYLLVGEFEDPRLLWSATQRWVVAMAAVILVFLSVLAHELSHSVMALSKGIRVRGITLFMFGGVSRFNQEFPRPITELMVALVGPLISIILAVIFGGVWVLMGGGDSPVEVVLVLLAWTNLSLGVFNLIPGYPLDGGRLLRAGIWGLTGDHRMATRIASLLGLLVGGSMLVGGVTLAVLMELINGVWLSIGGAFLFSMTRSSFPR